jgi:hypothetical protein
MRLINTTSLEVEEFLGIVPKYAILSHTWGVEEVTLEDWREARRLGRISAIYSVLSLPSSHNPPLSVDDATTSSPQRLPSLNHASTWPTDPSTLASSQQLPLGLHKILHACLRARADSLPYLWADTVCIDKTSSAELSEAINSMYAWYCDSAICYAFLSDVPFPSGGRAELSSPSSPFRRSRWHQRGWTLQELLAPKNLVFFSADWRELGSKRGLVELVSEITGIGERYLSRTWHVTTASIAQRLSWVAGRVTTRPEDVAYCLLGIFDVHMPLIYGEGSRAFVRLQEEIVKVSEDHSIFAWSWVAELSSSLMRGDRRNYSDATTARLRREVAATPRPGGFPEGRLAALMANTLWRNPSRCTLLAPDPICFWDCGEMGRMRPGGLHGGVRPFVMGNVGLTLRLPLIRHVEEGLVFAVLHEPDRAGIWRIYCVPLAEQQTMKGRYTRTWFPKGLVEIERPGGLELQEMEISVVRDIQHVGFFYPGFGGSTARLGFWLMVAGEPGSGWRLAGGHVARDGLFNSYGVFFDMGEVAHGVPVGGLLIFECQRRKADAVVLFLALSLVQAEDSGSHRHNIRYHCDVVTTANSNIQQQGLEDMYQTLIRKHSGSPSVKRARARGCNLWIRNEWPLSQARDARIALAEVEFPS